ncbi:RimJ/RimL family protein N-acetyltransferase [Stackebrandtia albiflava]|uniref:RimJ/RimL family protein N-acetyltransferase n=1 Tax=Stackebrandtia albiflava TaxID=406432 RepID=A0A562V2I7_9ACTN|nr:GNAT family protein [Stackebrandtia albiflava]TWJ12081.1 RimJ/RimL family protein N-acetyltransferase [Stackebrandtia albiflava]
MLIDHLPLYGLRVTPGDLELRLPVGEELAALAEVAAGGVHAADHMPFLVPWTVGAPEAVARSVLQHHWRLLSAFEPHRWTLPLVVFRDGRPVGIQSMRGVDFAVTGEVDSGSWLGRAHQGGGVGTRMRAAMLHLAFEGLGAVTATSGAFSDNPRSRRVSEKLGYRPDGLERVARDGAVGVIERLRLDRADWRPGRFGEVRVEGLPGCRDMFGVAVPGSRPGAAHEFRTAAHTTPVDCRGVRSVTGAADRAVDRYTP